LTDPELQSVLYHPKTGLEGGRVLGVARDDGIVLERLDDPAADGVVVGEVGRGNAQPDPPEEAKR